MRSKRAMIAALAIAAIGVGGAIAIAPAGASTSLAFTAKASGGAPVDVGRRGPSPGDQFLEHGWLKDSAGAPAGRFQLVGQLVSGKGGHGTELSSITLFLRDGTIDASGGHALAEGYTLPVSGGTGRYAGARGTLSVTAGPHESESLTLALLD